MLFDYFILFYNAHVVISTLLVEWVGMLVVVLLGVVCKGYSKWWESLFVVCVMGFGFFWLPAPRGC